MSHRKKTAAASDQVITVTGIIVPAIWDDRGNPVAILVATDQEEEFLLNMSGKKDKQLRNLMQQRVRISGNVETWAGREKSLNVKSFEKLDADAAADGGP